MKKIILSNWRFKLISLLVGFVIWILLVNISNPEVVRTKTVPLTVLNESVLTRAGKTYTLPNSDSVTVSYQVRTRDAYKIQAEDFRATVDLENLYDITGAVPVMVEVVGNRDLIGGMPTARPGVIRVDTENVQNKVFSLDTHEEGEPASGYEVGRHAQFAFGARQRTGVRGGTYFFGRRSHSGFGRDGEFLRHGTRHLLRCKRQ